MLILGIETSCDETGLALYGKNGLIGHTLYSQADLLAQYGGVVPEIASRNHIEKLTPLLHELITTTNTNLSDIQAIAYTKGPGLIGALLTGVTFAKALSFSLQIPAIAINHMEGHLLAVMLEEYKPKFPFVTLLASGGHTMLVKAVELGKYQILGETIDDAVGEAFDKCAKLLGLGYPGGSKLAKLAVNGRPDKFHFPRPLTNTNNLNFSFSGLKTAALNKITTTTLTSQTKADIAYAFQEAAIDTLVIKCKLALEQCNLNTLVIAGGVAANQLLRERLARLSTNLFYPKQEFCTDNGAMIAIAGFLHFLQGTKDNDLTINAWPRWQLGETTSLCRQ